MASTLITSPSSRAIIAVEVMAWTVDEEAEASAAFEMGITRVTTKEVERLLAWRMGLT